MRITREPLPTCFDAVARFIYGPQLVAVILQIIRPPPEPRRDFQNRTRRQTLANPRKNCAGPLRSRAAPRLRPFLARLFPIGTSFIEWLGAESNRRHVDFQSMFPTTPPQEMCMTDEEENTPPLRTSPLRRSSSQGTVETASASITPRKRGWREMANGFINSNVL